YDSVDVDPREAAAARQLLVEYDELCSSNGVTAGVRDAAWARLTNARQTYADVLAAASTAPAGPAPAGQAELAEAEQLQEELAEAEARARRPMSGPGAFKKFAAARRQFELFLAEHGATSLEELRSRGQAAAAPISRQVAADQLAAAEQQWQVIERTPAATGLPDSPAADAFRIRVYRLVRSVVDDAAIEPELRRRATAGERDPAESLERMAFALRALGVAHEHDLVGTARGVVASLSARR
ncbi:MAG: hypothetical protein AAFP84_19465, partial [Actinomycetota bacterium]